MDKCGGVLHHLFFWTENDEIEGSVIGQGILGNLLVIEFTGKVVAPT